MPRAAVQGPVHRPARNPNPAPPSPRVERDANPSRDDNPRRRRRKGGKRRRKNPRNPSISYKNGALIGAALGAIGVAIASSAKAPMPVISTDAGEFAVSAESSTKRALMGALRGAAVGLAVGVAATAVARELKVGAVGKVMNPSGPAAALILGSAVGATTLAIDHGLSKAIEAA